MISLLDVNVLVALFDPMHLDHEAAHAWFGRHRSDGWSTCPLTENGLVRILSNPAYPGRRTTAGDAVERLDLFRSSGDHVFWPDTVSVCQRSVVARDRLQGHRQLTDVYLLALARAHGGRLATFDRSIPVDAVVGASEHDLVLIPSA